MLFDCRSENATMTASQPISAQSIAAARPHRRETWVKLLSALFQLAEGRTELICHGERPWASATFSGTRHTVVLSFSGEALEVGERFVNQLPEHEFTIPGQLVADASVTEVTHSTIPTPELVVEMELLLLNDI